MAFKSNNRLLLVTSWGVLLLLAMTSQVTCRAITQADDYESTEQSEDQEVVDELHSFLPVGGRHKSSSSASIEASSNEDLCATIFCGNGRKCVIENGRPTCGCALSCPDHYHPVCGTDGVTYNNPCDLHRAACLQNVKIHKHLRGPCPGPPPTPEPEPEEEKPLVCYEIERDMLRQLLIDWMQGRVQDDTVNMPEKSYVHVLTENFRHCDLDGDDQLSGSEFIQCVEKNDTISEFTGMRPEQGHVLRGLCVDALILMSDTNEDWMLDLEEFLRCMDPNFEPPRKQCSLENKMYEDGAETRVDCNVCVCACGNWVCSAMSCEDIEDHNLFEPYDVEQGPLPSKEERYALLRGFIAAEHINLDRVEEEVPTIENDDTNGQPIDSYNNEEEDEDEPSPAEIPDTVHESFHSAGAFDKFWPDDIIGPHNTPIDVEEDVEPDTKLWVPETKQAVVSALEEPRSPPVQVDQAPDAEDDEALAEYLSPSVTARPTQPVEIEEGETIFEDASSPRHQKPSERVIAPQSQQSVQPQAPTQNLLKNHEESEYEPVEKEEAQDVVTPQPATAIYDTEQPPRRFIPIVNFNITVAEHRVIHTQPKGEDAQYEEQQVVAEALPQHEEGKHQPHQHRQHGQQKHNHHHSNYHHHHSTNHHGNHQHRPHESQQSPQKLQLQQQQ